MSLCECSHTQHKEACANEGTHNLKTKHGTFRLCGRCANWAHIERVRKPKDGAARSVADRAMLAAHRQRDRAADRHARYVSIAASMEASGFRGVSLVYNPNEWPWNELAQRREALTDAERTLAELTRGAGVPIAVDEERGGA